MSFNFEIHNEICLVLYILTYVIQDTSQIFNMDKDKSYIICHEDYNIMTYLINATFCS